MEYRKKIKIVEAVQWNWNNLRAETGDPIALEFGEDAPNWLRKLFKRSWQDPKGSIREVREADNFYLEIFGLRGAIVIHNTDYIIMEDFDSYAIMSAKMFKATFEPYIRESK